MTENKVILTVRLEERIHGFGLIADIAHPEMGDFYISSSTGKVALWKHAHKGKLLKVVLRPNLTVNVNDLPSGLAVKSKGGKTIYHYTPELTVNCPELAGVWQANTWRNCPFKPGTVRIKAKMFHFNSVMQEPGDTVDACHVQWENVAQFRVIGLCNGVQYWHDVPAVTAPGSAVPNFGPW